jgi:type I restriction enzyme, S subunit
MNDAHQVAIKKGYKQTDLGVIPEDWEVKRLGDIGDTIIGLTYSPSDVVDYGKLVHRSSNVQNNRLSYYDNVYVNKAIVEKLILRNNDILICVRNGSRDLIGKSALISGKAVGETFGAFMSVFRTDRCPLFVFHLILSNLIQLQINQSLGATINQITNKTLNDFQIPYPSKLEEQTAIATALSDTDALVEHLGKLIAKKKAIKQGLMNNLLNPHDIKGELKVGWELKSLFELADSRKELFDDGDWIEAEHITTEGVRLIQTGNIGVGKYLEKDLRKYIYEESFNKLRCKSLQIGDLLICRLAEPAGRACILPYIGDEKIITSVDVTIFRPRKEFANRVFLANLFSTDEWFKKINESVGGTTHKRISKGHLGKIKVALPHIEEQNSSAEIFSDMDTEISSLEQKRDKYAMLKKGMMQQLLTGKIRIYATN